VTSGGFFVTFNTVKTSRTVYTLACLATALVAFSCATVMQPGGVESLTVEQLKARIEAGNRPFVVDTRTAYEYRQGHLPGSVNIPHYEFDKLSRLLPADKGTEVVFYCRGLV